MAHHIDHAVNGVVFRNGKCVYRIENREFRVNERAPHPYFSCVSQFVMTDPEFISEPVAASVSTVPKAALLSAGVFRDDIPRVAVIFSARRDGFRAVNDTSAANGQ